MTNPKATLGKIQCTFRIFLEGRVIQQRRQQNIPSFSFLEVKYFAAT